MSWCKHRPVLGFALSWVGRCCPLPARWYFSALNSPLGYDEKGQKSRGNLFFFSAKTFQIWLNLSGHFLFYFLVGILFNYSIRRHIMYVRYKLECDYTKSFGFFFLKGWNIESSYFFCIVVAVDIFHVTKLQIYSQQIQN